MNDPINMEQIAEAVHDAYLDTCKKLGWAVKPSNQVPYRDLTEESKELDRASVRAVLRFASPRPKGEPAAPCCATPDIGFTYHHVVGELADLEAVLWCESCGKTAKMNFIAHKELRKAAEEKFGFTAPETPEGEKIGNYGDWILRDVNGQVYPCRPDIFEATYEPAKGQEGGAT